MNQTLLVVVLAIGAAATVLRMLGALAARGKSRKKGLDFENRM